MNDSSTCLQVEHRQGGRRDLAAIHGDQREPVVGGRDHEHDVGGRAVQDEAGGPVDRGPVERDIGILRTVDQRRPPLAGRERTEQLVGLLTTHLQQGRGGEHR